MDGKTAQEQAVITNLVDAGCDSELIEKFMELLKNRQTEAGLSLLAKPRRFLLDCYHAEQKKIDCLDYLVYKLNRQNRK